MTKTFLFISESVGEGHPGKKLAGKILLTCISVVGYPGNCSNHGEILKHPGVLSLNSIN